jgi:hypothetical protein
MNNKTTCLILMNEEIYEKYKNFKFGSLNSKMKKKKSIKRNLVYKKKWSIKYERNRKITLSFQITVRVAIPDSNLGSWNRNYQQLKNAKAKERIKRNVARKFFLIPSLVN